MQDKAREQLVNLTFLVQQAQNTRAVLGPYLLHDSELASLSAPDPELRCLALHPRISAPEQLPESVRQDCAALAGVCGTEVLGPLTDSQRTRLFTVVFFSRSRSSPALRHGLPESWRRVLSNFYASPLELDGAQYATVEHFFQARKSLCSDRPELAQ
jgi:hypothetical protein